MNTPAGGVTLPEVKAAIAEADRMDALWQENTHDFELMDKSAEADSKAVDLALAYCRAALAGEWRVPDGWRLVPVEATPQMLGDVGPMEGFDVDAGYSADKCHAAWYAAMVAAAPLPKEPGR